MPKTVTITLDETEYTFPKLDLGQIEDLAEFVDAAGKPIIANGQPLEGGKAAITWTLDRAAIVFRKASPPIENVRSLSCSSAEISEAILAIFRLSGLTRELKPGEAKAETRAAA